MVSSRPQGTEAYRMFRVFGQGDLQFLLVKPNPRKLGRKALLFAGSPVRIALIALGMTTEEAHLAGLLLLQEM